MTVDEQIVADLAEVARQYEHLTGEKPTFVAVPLGRRHRVRRALERHGHDYGLALRIVRPPSERRR